MFFWPKMHFNRKKHPKFLKRLIFILEKGAFFFEPIFPVVARTWIESRSELFWGPKSRFLAKKSDFCHTIPIMVNCPFLAVGDIVHFPPAGQFFYFSFPSYSRFRKKKRSTSQKFFPLPTVRALSAINSPSALRAQALRARAL